MCSEFDSMAALFGAPMLFSHFGERDESTNEPPTIYYPPSGGQSVPWTEVIVGQLTLDEDALATGAATEKDELREQVEITRPAGTAAALGGLVAVAKYPGERFVIDSVTEGATTIVKASRFAVRSIRRRGPTGGA